MFGVAYKKEEEKAEELCLTYCSKGSKLALGLKHFFGWKTKINQDKALQIFLEMEKEDEKYENKETKYALYLIGRCHFKAIATNKDLQKAIKYYEKSSQLGVGLAYYSLGYIYEDGFQKEGIERDIHKAIFLYQKAFEHGHIGSCYNMAIIYYKGDAINGIKRDPSKAIELYEIAVRNNFPDAMFNLSLIYQKGENDYGIKKNIHKTIELLQRAVDLNDCHSMHALAFIYSKGDKDSNFERDFDKACSLFFRSFTVEKFRKSEKYFLDLIKNQKQFINWKKEYHVYWKKNDNLNKQIVFILLMSKHRNLLKNKTLEKTLVNGIAINIIKFLCHFSPEEEIPENTNQANQTNDKKQEKSCLLF